MDKHYNVGKNNPMFGIKSPNKGKSGKNSPNYKNGKTFNNKCIDCGKKISFHAVRCCKCAGIQHRNPNGRKYSKHYCIKCQNKQIAWQTWYYGKKTCAKCSTKGSKKLWVTKSLKGKKRPEHSKKLLGIKTGKRLVNHHIYLKENSDETMLFSAKNHQKLHQRAYDYLIKLGLIKKYIKWFIKKYGR